MATSTISKPLKYIPSNYQLLNQSATGNKTNHTTYLNRKISDYYVLFIIALRNGIYRTSFIIPVTVFQTGAEVDLTEVDSANTQRWYGVRYVNDTTISIQCSSNAEGSMIMIYGLGSDSK